MPIDNLAELQRALQDAGLLQGTSRLATRMAIAKVYNTLNIEPPLNARDGLDYDKMLAGRDAAGHARPEVLALVESLGKRDPAALKHVAENGEWVADLQVYLNQKGRLNPTEIDPNVVDDFYGVFTKRAAKAEFGEFANLSELKAKFDAAQQHGVTVPRSVPAVESPIVSKGIVASPTTKPVQNSLLPTESLHDETPPLPTETVRKEATTAAPARVDMQGAESLPTRALKITQPNTSIQRNVAAVPVVETPAPHQETVVETAKTEETKATPASAPTNTSVSKSIPAPIAETTPASKPTPRIASLDEIKRGSALRADIAKATGIQISPVQVGDSEMPTPSQGAPLPAAVPTAAPQVVEHETHGKTKPKWLQNLQETGENFLKKKAAGAQQKLDELKKVVHPHEEKETAPADPTRIPLASAARAVAPAEKLNLNPFPTPAAASMPEGGIPHDYADELAKRPKPEKKAAKGIEAVLNTGMNIVNNPLGELAKLTKKKKHETAAASDLQHPETISEQSDAPVAATKQTPKTNHKTHGFAPPPDVTDISQITHVPKDVVVFEVERLKDHKTVYVGYDPTTHHTVPLNRRETGIQDITLGADRGIEHAVQGVLNVFRSKGVKQERAQSHELDKYFPAIEGMVIHGKVRLDQLPNRPESEAGQKPSSGKLQKE